MKIWRKVIRAGRALFQKEKLDAEMSEEMRSHVEMRAQSHIKAGVGAEEARYAALRQFGWKESILEECREQRGVTWLENLVQDVRFGARQLRKNPGFTTVAVLTLALGIGSCSAIFSVVDRVLLRPLAYPGSDRLVVLRETKLPQWPEFAIAPANYIDWRDQAVCFDQLVAIRDTTYNLTWDGDPVRVTAERVTPNFLKAYRTQPLLGRDFSEAEVAAQAKVALLTHGFWMRQFGGRRGIVGETLHLDGQSFVIAGVLPVTFQPGGSVELYTPLRYDEDREKRGSKGLRVIGRLKENVTLATAGNELDVIASRLATRYPESNTGWGVKVTPMLESMVGQARPVLFSLLGAVAFLLAIGCANVANLLLARAATRSNEITVRAALGASRCRIVTQLLTESLLLGTLGGLLGFLFAFAGVRAFVAAAPVELPRLVEVVLDRRAFGFSLILSLLTGIVFGLIPALHATRKNFSANLKRTARGAGTDRGRQRLRALLGIGEVAMALVMLVGSGLLFRSFTQLLSVNPGFQSHGVVAVTLSLPERKYATDPQQAAFAEQCLAKFQAIPGVKSAAVANMLPLLDASLTYAFSIPGQPAPDSSAVQSALFHSVSSDYFQTMGISVLRGRAFTPADRAGAPPVAIVNESMALKYFPGQDPIGRRINLASGECEIVGIIADVKPRRLEDSAGAQSYVPFQQVPFSSMSFVLRGPERSAVQSPAIRAALAAIDKAQPIASIRPFDELLHASLARNRFVMFVFGSFSALGLALAALGLYGVVAYSVAQRTSEIGLRMALGAGRSQVLLLFLRQSGTLVAFGLLCGVAIALFLTRLLSSMLFGIEAYDPITYAVTSILLALIAFAACLVPASRAARLDPMVALRTE